MESQSIEVEQPTAAVVLPQEIRHVPLWVKGIVIVGVILFAIQLPNFKSSLTDAILKQKASDAEKAGQYMKEAEFYSDLLSRYPNDKGLVKKLGFAQYHAGLYSSALNTFNLLEGVKLPNREIEEINAAVSDIAEKLQLNIK